MAYNAVLYGPRIKRKRNEVEGLDDDPNSKRKMRCLVNGDDDDEEENLEFGKIQKSIQINAMREEEEMSEDEIKRQLE